MLIYSYSKSLNTEVLLLETKTCLKYKEVVKKKQPSTSCCTFYLEQTVSLTMEIVTVIVLLSKNEPQQELTHEGLQNT